MIFSAFEIKQNSFFKKMHLKCEIVVCKMSAIMLRSWFASTFFVSRRQTSGIPHKSTVVSQFTGTSIVCSIVCWLTSKKKIKSLHYWPFVQGSLCVTNVRRRYNVTVEILWKNYFQFNYEFDYPIIKFCTYHRCFWHGQNCVMIWHHGDSAMTSSNGNIFHVTGHLCGEFTGHRWILRTKASDAELWSFLWSAPE